MKHDIYHFFAGAALLLPVFFTTACNSVTPARFNRYYSAADGSCVEVISYNGAATENRYNQTNLAKLFAKYPEAKAPAGSEKSGAYFYFVEKEDAGFGSGTGDYAERTAFLLLDRDDAYAKSSAVKIRDYLIGDDAEKMITLYEKTAGDAGVREERSSAADGDKKTPSYLREYKVDAKGNKIPHGLTRVFYDDGMIASDRYYRNGKQEGAIHRYNQDCSVVR